MGMSRVLGGLLCVVCAVIIVFWILFPLAPAIGRPFWIFQPYIAPLWIVVPVVLGIVVLAGLGFWLGWIMATTKEVTSPPPVTEASKEKKK